jgi:hypothetical protein
MKMELIEQLIESELKEVDEKWPNYHSHHEAYAVIKEEVEELGHDLQVIEMWLANYWQKVKGANGYKHEDLKVIKTKAKEAIAESVQVYVTALRAERLINKNNK